MNDNAPMRILWVAFIFPPYGGSQGLRMKKYLEHIDRLSGESLYIDVLTIRPSRHFPQYDSSLEKALDMERIRVHRISAGIFHHIRYAWGLEGRYLSGSSRIKHLVAKAVSFLSNIMWLPVAILWIVKKRLVGDDSKYDAVYTFMDPFSSLIVGLIAKSLYRARWVVEYGDPWRIKPTTQEKFGLLRWIGGFMERKVLNAADNIIVRAQTVVDAYRRIYPMVAAEKYMNLYGGIEWDEYDGIKVQPQKEKFLICHTGILYGDSINPRPFFEAIRRLVIEGVPVEVLMLGATDHEVLKVVEECGIENHVAFKGHRPYSEVVVNQKSADLLVAFGFNTIYKIPSKIAQYIAARKPILYLAELKEDPSARLIEQNNRGIVVPNSAEYIQKAIKKIYKSSEYGKLEDHFDFSTMENISFSYIASKIMDALVPKV